MFNRVQFSYGLQIGLLGVLVALGGAGLTASAIADDKPAPGKTEQEAKLGMRVSGLFPGDKIYSRPTSSDARPEPEDAALVTRAVGMLKPLSPGAPKDPKSILKGVAERTGMSVVQVVFTGEQAIVYLKAARNLDTKLQTLKLEDKNGNQHVACGYMVQKGESLEINFAQNQRLETISEIKALDKLGKNESLHLVFYVPKGVTLVKLHAANKSVPVG